MKIFTNTLDLAQPTPKRFWVAPYSDFKIGIKLVKNGAAIENNFTVKSGSTTLVADDDKVGGFTVFTLNSGAQGSVEYTVEVEGVSEHLNLIEIVTDSTVFDIDERGGDMSPYATKNWVESEISGFIDESDLTSYYTKSETSSATEIGTALEGKQPTGNYLTEETEPAFAAMSADIVVDGDLTAYYTKSETSSATEIAEALAGAGGSAISAFDMSENPVQSKTIVEAALKNRNFLPETIVKYSDGSISSFNVDGEFSSGSIENAGNAVDVMIGRNVTTIRYNTFSGDNFPNIEKLSIPNNTTLSTTLITQEYGNAKLNENGIFLEEGILSVGINSLATSFIGNNKTIRNINFLPKSLQVIGNRAFMGQSSAINTYGLTGEVVIPDNITYIGFEAFKNNKGLSSIVFGEYSKASLQGSAFAIDLSNKGNIRIYKRDGVLPIGSGSLGSGTDPIYVPDNLLSSYQSNSNWTQYSSRLKPLSEYYAPSKVTNLSSVAGIMKISQADYSALSAGGTADANTLYIIVD